MSTQLLSLDKLNHIINNIIADFSKYMQNTIDRSQARESIGYGIAQLSKYQYGGESHEYGCKLRCVLPKRYDIVEISLLLNMEDGLARYLLSLRHEGDRKYAVHKNKITYIDSNNPSKPFDKLTMKIIDKRTKYTLATNSSIKNNEIVKSSIIRVPNVFKISVKNTQLTAESDETKIKKSMKKITIDDTSPKNSSATKLNSPKSSYIVCPTNNIHCCYKNNKHNDDKCNKPSMKCCLGEIHYHT